jgi:hypothetical protein
MSKAAGAMCVNIESAILKLQQCVIVKPVRLWKNERRVATDDGPSADDRRGRSG